ncbi:MAG: hypothetical protein L6Q71_07400 [Planctomycetes bacterium]|nr:hypothetical protein [Planctomycetota bacterium]NUQ35125.1 hypothetical protein [Planctomycetaceae bacterium]
MFSSSRSTQRGAFRVDILMMVLVLVVTITVAVFTFITYGEYNKDEESIRKMEYVAEAHTAEWSRLKQAAYRACEPLGFRGLDGGVSDDEGLRRFLDSMSDQNYKPYVVSIADDAKGQEGDKGIKVSEAWSPGNAPKLDKVGAREETNWKFDLNNATLKKLIAVQDKYINKLATDALPVFGKERERELRETADALGIPKAGETPAKGLRKTVNDKVQEWRGKHDAKENALETATSTHEGEAQTARARATEVEGGLTELVSNAEQQAKDVEDKRKLLHGPRAEATRLHEEAVTMIAERIRFRARTDASDGYVAQVDPISGYVWIDLGQADNVRAEMTFQVLRPSADKESLHPIGDIRVKEVRGDHLSRCRVDALDNPDVQPRAGDLIRSQGYDPQQYRRFAFIGEFGAGQTRHSKQQLSDLLFRFGMVVVPELDETVEVIVIGGNWENDPALKLNADSTVRPIPYKFTTMTERDVLYMFGMIGPNPLGE